MNEINDLERKTNLLKNLCIIYPNYKPQILKKLIKQFDCDVDKITEYLSQESLGESFDSSSYESMRQNPDESIPTNVFSFMSMNSENSGYSSSSQISKSYRSSSELNKIFLQKTDLQKLDDAFKRLEKHRDFLNREALFMGEVIERRKSEFDFPNVNDVDSLDVLVNKKYSMPVKSMSYANDLRQPSEMNRRYAGFHGVYNQYPNRNTNNNNNDIQNYEVRRQNDNQHLERDQLNPNLYHSSQKINEYLAPFNKLNEKRYSAHFDQGIELSKEFTVAAPFIPGHSRQRSDPRVFGRPLWWDCPQCETPNSSDLCSFCVYDPKSSKGQQHQ